MRNKFLYSKNFYEKLLWPQGSLVCGVDEVGRGCLAGPVVVAAVILFAGCKHRLLKDSKILKKEEREEAFSWIIKNSWYSWVAVDHETIDRVNIWNATLQGMRQSVLNVIFKSGYTPKIVLVDAMPLNLSGSFYQDIEVQHFIEGESHSVSIAAASIVAKVIRDDLMDKVDKIFPGYSFNSHKGYSTKLHKDALIDSGHTIIHRMSYLKNFKEEESDERQESIFG